MYCIGLKKDDRPLIVDDIISSGGTQITTVKALEKHDYDIVGIGTVYERGNGIENVKRETGHTVKGLARLEMIDKRLFVPRVLDTKF